MPTCVSPHQIFRISIQLFKVILFLLIIGTFTLLLGKPKTSSLHEMELESLQKIMERPQAFFKTLSKNSRCNILTTYDGILGSSVHRGYGFLAKKTCLHPNSIIKTNLKQYSHSDCRFPVLVMHTMGRLGNQICEYLTGKLLQVYFKVPVALEDTLHTTISKNFVDFDLPVHNKTCRNDTRSGSIEFIDKLLFENYIMPKHHPIHNLLNRSYLVTNYPCLMDLLMNNRKEISKSLKYKPSVIVEARRNLRKALISKNFRRKDRTTISLHVRRTDYDYRLNIVFNRTYLSPCYYEQAMHHYRLMFPRTVFVVASDDIEWCKKNLDDLDVVFLESSNDTNPIVDMASMSLCDHHIVGLGTFGFLAAYLSGTGFMTHSFVLGKKLTEFENDLLCSDSRDLIAIPDLGLSDLRGIRSPS